MKTTEVIMEMALDLIFEIEKEKLSDQEKQTETKTPH